FRKLKNEGYKVALDDFGTAYASLEMLRNLPASIIKIEHSFVRELADPGHDIDYVIIDSLLSMCRKLKCNAIVEGVESEKVADMIKDLDTTMLQGYYYSKPVPREEFEKMLESQK
ncbi:MAG: EAL domain-containing protein, partial [Oscillospiraceae bacterium]|nr:EAL domain-containing protein [Oscillospiraceae bacterium]